MAWGVGMEPAGRPLGTSPGRQPWLWHGICSSRQVYSCAIVAPVSRWSCDVAGPPPETHRPRGRADDGLGETWVRRHGRRGNAPGRLDQLCGRTCGARVCGLTTGGGHSALPSPAALSLSSISLLSAVSAVLWLASPSLPVVSSPTRFDSSPEGLVKLTESKAIIRHGGERAIPHVSFRQPAVCW
jgi:hypothetical protein